VDILKSGKGDAMAVVMITGSSSGFGLATALAFARRGDDVWATMRNPADAGDLSAAVEAEHLQVATLPLDVNDAASVTAAVGRLLEVEGRIDVLVNNAGVAHMGAVEVLSVEDAKAVFDTNVFGQVRMIQAVLPGMRERGEGVIVNVSSVAGRLPGTPANWAYAASKHAAGSLADSLAEEVRSFGVRVVCVEPGFFATDLIRKAHPLPPASPYTDMERKVAAWFNTNVRAGGDPSIVADAIVAAVNDPSTPVHVPVGAGAHAAIQAASNMTGEKWAALSRVAYGLEPA
jgi:NAD(P)-dependent dehydrogenase (short-subunit alcohol dehydrogenase family)